LYEGTAYGSQLVANILVAPGQTVTAPAPESWGAKLESDLGITKTASTSTPALGGTVSFTLTMTNAGPAAATGASFADSLPAGLGTITNVVSTVAGGATTASFTIGNEAISGLANLPVGAQAQVTFQAKVSTTAPPTLTNQATIAAPTDRLDPNPANNTASQTLNVIAPDITASLVLPASAPAGSVVSGTMTVSNSGAGIATGVTGAVTLPGSSTPINLTFGDIAASGGAAQRNFTVTVPTSGPSLTLTASAATTAVESNTANNGATSNALTVQYADVTTQITLPASAAANSVVSGTVVFTNSAAPGLSAATATAVTGSVTFSSGAAAQTFNIGDLAPGATVSRPFTVTLPVAGILTVTSSVATTAVESNAANNSASASVDTGIVVSSGGGGGCTTNPDAAFDPLLLLLLLGGGLATVRRQRQTRH